MAESHLARRPLHAKANSSPAPEETDATPSRTALPSRQPGVLARADPAAASLVVTSLVVTSLVVTSLFVDGPTAANPAVLLPNFSLRDSIATYYLTVTEGFCVSKDTVRVTIHPRQLSYFFPPAAQCQFESSVDFSSYYDSIANSTYQWDFSAAATPATSSIAFPTGIHFTSSGLINNTFRSGSSITKIVEAGTIGNIIRK